ncbi:MAG: peptide chain release factor N(5)-glutamine methyltransferase [Selenomonadaceae bacterium]|nr:peptide chain release factor N(5)-glutamine methyltransferase [Selenomonadaceae bacterium]
MILTIQNLLRRATEFLTQNGIDEARLDAEVLLAHVLRMRRLYLYVHLDLNLVEEDINIYKNLVHRRAAHVPVAQLIGLKEFMGLEFNITPDVLIPRPETEIMVQMSIEILGPIKDAITVADIGTGSGSIAVSMLHYLDNVTADATDISKPAIAVARSNAEKFGVGNRLNLFEGNLTEPLVGRTYDAILSNPPYIPTAVIDELQPEVSRYEPRLALDGGADGLKYYQRIIDGSVALLKPDGFLALEVGVDQSEPVRKMLEANGQFDPINMIWDLIGIERIILAYKKCTRD